MQIVDWIGGLQGFESADAHPWIVRWICRLITSKGNSKCTSIELYSCKLPISGQSSTTLCLMSMARDPINPNDIINGPWMCKHRIIGLEDGASDSASTQPQKTRKHRKWAKKSLISADTPSTSTGTSQPTIQTSHAQVDLSHTESLESKDGHSQSYTHQKQMAH